MATAHQGSRLGGSPFNHGQSSDSEAEYDRLRDQARAEHDKASSCFARSHQAYESHDGAAAHQLSEEGKQHNANAAQYNQQASDFIFRENNAPGRVAEDTIDLHGQFVEEAERIVETRIRAATQQGQNHLHVIVGKGNHSRDHVQKIKPKVEEVCRELGLEYRTEENEGRIYVQLRAGAPGAGQPSHAQPQHSQQQQQQYPGGGGGASRPGHPQQQMQQEQQEDSGGCLKGCCAVM